MLAGPSVLKILRLASNVNPASCPPPLSKVDTGFDSEDMVLLSKVRSR